jgi:16S rRNA G966 N2-methylase RsmD
MPIADVAQYGIGFFAIAGLVYVVLQFISRRSDLAAVVENNTKALEQLTSLMQAIQLSLTRQEAKIDELLERARR